MIRHKKLLASIHDVTPAHAWRLSHLMETVETVIGGGYAALLVVPDFHGQGLIDSDKEFASKLRGWSDAGNEVFLHGFYHQDRVDHTGGVARFKARHLTAGEGEFLGIDLETARTLLVDGRNRIEDVIGRSVTGFVAPAWLYGDAATLAIADLGFAIAEDHFKVWQPPTGKVIARGPVITYASRSPSRLLSSLLWSRVASVALKPLQVVRIGVHPHDWDAPELVTEISRCLGDFARTHRPAHYADLLI
jgi:predicted deacetylase